MLRSSDSWDSATGPSSRKPRPPSVGPRRRAYGQGRGCSRCLFTELRGEAVWRIGPGPKPGLPGPPRGDEGGPIGRSLPPKTHRRGVFSYFPNGFGRWFLRSPRPASCITPVQTPAPACEVRSSFVPPSGSVVRCVDGERRRTPHNSPGVSRRAGLRAFARPERDPDDHPRETEEDPSHRVPGPQSR